MSDEIWVVRAGRKAIYAQDFLDGGFVGIGFQDLATDDLSQTDEASLKARITTNAERAYAGQLTAFAYKIDVDDLVVVPRLTPKHRDYLVGRVAGAYRHVAAGPPSGNHQRPVEWLGRFPQDVLSQAANNTLGAILTLFRPTAVEAELRAHLTRLEPIEAPRPPTVSRQTPPADLTTEPPPAPVPGVPGSVTPARYSKADLDVELDQQGRARVVSRHPALLMEQVPRHLDPSDDWSNVPGVYILTGTELQSTAVRTGLERTLTTTMIVRPWAYVGLTENFRGRLGSHKQSKAEWRRALLVRSNGVPFGGDDIRYLEQRIHSLLVETGEVALSQATPNGNVSAQPRQPSMLDACADTVVAVLRLTGTLI